MITVAIDAMGPDAGPAVVVEGAARASREDVPVRVLLVGDEPVLSALLEDQRYDATRLSIVHTPEAIRHDEHPARALDAKPNCSVKLACDLVAAGEAQAVIGAGNTGALILAAARTFGRLDGIRRAALATVHPTEQRHGPHDDPFALMLDVGATIEATAEDLVGFAVMGSAYSQVISDIPAPKVALLSNGTEKHKGTPQIVEANALLSAHGGLNFVGNVEGLDIARGTVDVIVCDGFLGNVVLKMLEGVSEVFADIAKDAYARKFLFKLGLTMLSQGIQQIRRMTDWRQYGGAPLLGLDEVVIKAHGRSDARAMRNAIRVARKAVDRDLSGKIREGMARGVVKG
jgi:glycerol-3-phosphate acyltransferase PlsX